MTFAVSFDFDAKRIERIGPADVAGAVAAGRYCWIDLDDCAAAADLMRELDAGRSAAARVAADQRLGHAYVGRSSIHCTFAETRIVDDDLALSNLHVVLGRGFLLTAHRERSEAIDGIRKTYQEDFHASARTGGFLLFEIADHLIGGYREALTTLSTQVENVQKSLLGDIGDEILHDVSELTRALLDYRGALVMAREAIDELATRRSDFVPESTQPFLDRQTTPLDRLANDAATERTVLSESLNLYMGLVSHRTNKVVNRLTIVSMVFLPLNFLAAVYGMNFRHLPELEWRYGYFAFWLFCAVLVGTLLYIAYRKRWF